MKLLNNTIKWHLLYSVLILLIAIPIFYFIIQTLCLGDVDEALTDRKELFVRRIEKDSGLLKHIQTHDLSDIVSIYPPVPYPQNEKIITLEHYNNLSDENEPFRELHTTIDIHGQHYPVIFRTSLIYTEDLAEGIVWAAIVLMVLILGGLLLINWRQSKKVWQPFYQILDQLKQFSLDKNPNFQDSPTNILEFIDLKQVAKTLTEGAYTTYLQQKEFTENAAHEMQTPLASIQARLEVMLQDEQLSEKQTEHIQLLEDAVLRMTKLNRGLLLLAKIENKQFQEIESINVAQVSKKLLLQFVFQLQHKQLEISETYQDCIINANPILVDILISNLLKNAIQYAPKGSSIFVNVFSNSIKVSNRGEAFSFPKERLFNRFQKSYRIGNHNQNGLGLAIVKQICNAFNYKVQYFFNDNLHQFTIEFNN